MLKIKNWIANTFISIQSFPFTILFSFVGSVFLCYLIQLQKDPEILGIKLTLSFAVAVPIFFGIEILNQRRYFHKFISYAFGLILVMAIYYLYLPDALAKDWLTFDFFKVFLLAVLAHLWVSFAPFIRINNQAGFWAYNKTLFLSIFTAFLYSGTLTLGLFLAAAAIENLFGIEIKYRYGYILVMCNGIFNTLVFASKVKTISEIESDDTYPNALKLFAQYVLLPLVALYILIVGAYESKILIAWSLPKGWVSLMILALSIFGILAFLLLYPLKQSNKWVLRFNKLFYWLLLPLLALMIVAVYFRINQYGITEPRYIVAMLSIWLLSISLYFILSKKDDIRFIPMSLFFILLICVLGPINAKKISVNNQTKRLKELFGNSNEFNNAIPKVKLNDLQKDQAGASLEYLAENNPEKLSEFLSKKDFLSFKSTEKYNKAGFVQKLLKLKNKNSDSYKYISIENSNYEILEKADYRIEIDFGKLGKSQLFDIENKLENDVLSLKINNEKIEFDISSIKKLNGTSNKPETMSQTKNTNTWKAKLQINNISLRDEIIDNYRGIVYLTRLK